MNEINVCQYPIALDRVCGTKITQSGGPGAPKKYCDHPDHTAVKAWRRQQELEAKAAKAAAKNPGPSTLPVTDGTTKLSGLIARMEQLQGELAAHMIEAAEIVVSISDPTTVAEEIAEIRRECDRRVSEAESAAAAAHRAAADATIERNRALAAAERANAAAEEAVGERDRMAKEIDRSREEAAELVAAAHAERDQAKAAADTEISKLREDIAALQVDQALTEQQRDAATSSLERHTVEVGRLRGELAAQQQSYHEQLQAMHVTHLENLTAERRAADQTMREMRDAHSAELAAWRADRQSPLPPRMVS